MSYPQARRGQQTLIKSVTLAEKLWAKRVLTNHDFGRLPIPT